MNGWIKLHRKFKEWEWYKKPEMVHLFIHFLILANHEENKWQGSIIKRGQFITGLQSLNEATGISVQSLRTCINRLKSTGEITNISTNKNRLITIINWEQYQPKEIKSTSKSTSNLTNNQQTTNKQLTANKNDKNIKNDNNITFELFWNLYDKKRDRPKAEFKWNKLNEEEKEDIINYIPRYKIATPDKQFRKDPTTFLNNRSWENEIIEKRQDKWNN